MRISDWSSDVCSSDLLVGSLSYLEQRVVAGRARVGRVEQQAVREALSPAGRELPVLALDVVDDGGTGPGQQRRDHEANALARARRREGHDVLRSEEHTSELQSLMRISYAVFCLKKKTRSKTKTSSNITEDNSQSN